MSAAIEGIQTCFHQGHTMEPAGSTGSILHRHPLTYPALLTSFALVGAIMQWLARLTHELRDIELEYESQQLYKSNNTTTSCNKQQQRFSKTNNNCQQLSAIELQGTSCCNNVLGSQLNSSPKLTGHSSPHLSSISSNSKAATVGSKQRVADSIGSSHSSLVKETNAQVNCDSGSRDISLKSLRRLDSSENLSTIGKQQESPDPKVLFVSHCARDSLESGPISGFESSWPKRDFSSRVRNLSSPAALLVCATIIYVFHEG